MPEAEHQHRHHHLRRLRALRRAWVIFVMAWAAFALGFAARSGAGRFTVVLIAALAAATGVAAVALWRRS